jgi:hypothetical protein
MAHVGLVEPAREVIEGIVEGTEHQGLLAAFEDLRDEGQDGGGLGDVVGAGAGQVASTTWRWPRFTSPCTARMAS